MAEQELFKAIFKLEGDNSSLLKSLDEVNAKYKEQNFQFERQKLNLKTLTEREAELTRGRANANNPTAVAKYNKALDENKVKIEACKKAMENLTVTEQKAGKEADTLNKKLDAAFETTQINAAKTSVEKFNKTIADGEKPVTSLRSQLKALKAQLAETDDDKEFLRLSIEAGKLEDKINDANQAARIFATDSPFQAIGNSIRGVAGDLISMDFAGAAQKSKLLVDATKQLTFAKSLEGVRDLGTALFNVGKSLLMNPIFLIGAAVVAIIANFDELKKLKGPVGDFFRGISSFIGEATQALKDFSDWLGITAFAAEASADRNEKASKRIRDAEVKKYEYAIKVAQAAGEKTLELEKKRLAAVLNSLSAEQKAIIRAGSAAGSYTDEQKKRLQEIFNESKDTINEIDVLIAATDKKNRDDAEMRRKEAEKKAYEDRQKAIDAEIAQRKKQLEFEEGGTDDLERIQKEQREKADKEEIQAKQNQEQTKLEIDLVNSAKSVDIEKEEAARKKVIHDKELVEKKQRILEEITAIQSLISTATQTSQAVINIKIQEIDALSDIQQKRVNDAKSIADKGNAELVELEQKRLDDLTEQRKKFVAQQQALATLELIANTAIAVSKAAAQGGALAAIGIVAALSALGVGLLQARSMASQAAYYEGGYTGDGNPRDVSHAIGQKPYTYHKGEFVFDHEKTGKYKGIFQDIHSGNIDLNEWRAKVIAFESMRMLQNGSNVDFTALEKKMDALIMVTQSQSSSINLDENGFSAHMKNIITRNDFIKNHLARA